MSFFKIIDAFTFYGIDTAVLAALTCIIVQILKKTALKGFKKKIITFLPFVTGCILFAAYVCACNLSYTYLLENYVDVLERGFTVGSLSTVIYVWYEQFIREKDNVSATEGVIATLVEGYVPSDEVENVAKQIAQAIQRDVVGDGAKKTAEILAENSGEGVTEKDVTLLSKLIIETLAHLNTL
ncbi:MAG: hypothetical protein ACI4L9_02950 [Candidatus Coproplasma sp.]